MTRIHTLLGTACFVATCAVSTASSQTTDGALFGSWKMDCTSTDVCQAFLNLQQANGDTVASFSLLATQDSPQTTMIIRTPEMVALPPGAQIQAGSDQRYSAPFQFCGDQTCTAILTLEPGMVDALSGEDQMQVVYVPYGRSAPLAYPVPIDGFAEAVSALRQ